MKLLRDLVAPTSPLLCYRFHVQPWACLSAPQCLPSLPITPCGPLAQRPQTWKDLGKCPGHQTWMQVPRTAPHRVGTSANPDPAFLWGQILIAWWLGKASNYTRDRVGHDGCAEARTSMTPSSHGHAQPDREPGEHRLLGRKLAVLPGPAVPQLE